MCRIPSAHEYSELHELRILLQVAAHHLMPVIDKYVARHESLAHSRVGVLEIDVVFVEPQDDNIMSIVPLFGGGIGCSLFTAPRLNERDHRIASSLDFIFGKVRILLIDTPN